MTDVTTLLAGIKTRAGKATEGPWSDLDAQIRHTQIDGWVDPKGKAAAQKQTAADIEFVKNARTDVPRLVAAIEAVAGLHKPSTVRRVKHNSHGTLISYRVTEDGPCVACYPPSSTVHCESCDDGMFGECEGVSTGPGSHPWPCPTITAVVAALGGGE